MFIRLARPPPCCALLRPPLSVVQQNPLEITPKHLDTCGNIRYISHPFQVITKHGYISEIINKFKTLFIKSTKEHYVRRLWKLVYTSCLSVYSHGGATCYCPNRADSPSKILFQPSHLNCSSSSTIKYTTIPCCTS